MDLNVLKESVQNLVVLAKLRNELERLPDCKIRQSLQTQISDLMNSEPSYPSGSKQVKVSRSGHSGFKGCYHLIIDGLALLIRFEGSSPFICIDPKESVSESVWYSESTPLNKRSSLNPSML